MKKINVKILVITCVVCLLPIILGLVFYNQLPESVAIHFDINGNPDSYFPKAAFVFGMPLLMVILQMLCCIPSDLANENQEANKKAMSVYKWIIPMISVVLYTITVMYALGNKIDIRAVVMIIVGIVFIITGNYLPKSIGNRAMRFPKIKDENLAKRINRIYGYLLMIDGILCIISILFNPIVSILAVGIVILQAIVLCAYSLVKNK